MKNHRDSRHARNGDGELKIGYLLSTRKPCNASSAPVTAAATPQFGPSFERLTVSESLYNLARGKLGTTPAHPTRQGVKTYLAATREVQGLFGEPAGATDVFDGLR